MSRKFKVPLGLVGLAADPDTGLVGDMYYNTLDKLIYTYDGTRWVSPSDFGNLDGGLPDTVYGGINAIDAGGV